jgi:hypothetical protein
MQQFTENFHLPHFSTVACVASAYALAFGGVTVVKFLIFNQFMFVLQPPGERPQATKL